MILWVLMIDGLTTFLHTFCLHHDKRGWSQHKQCSLPKCHQRTHIWGMVHPIWNRHYPHVLYLNGESNQTYLSSYKYNWYVYSIYTTEISQVQSDLKTSMPDPSKKSKWANNFKKLFRVCKQVVWCPGGNIKIDISNILTKWL